MALKEISSLLPLPKSKDSKGAAGESRNEGNANSTVSGSSSSTMSKASTVEQAIEYIKQLKKELAEKTKEEAEKAKEQGAPQKPQRCVSCAHLKLKCSGGNPCALCQRSSILCRYDPPQNVDNIDVDRSRPGGQDEDLREADPGRACVEV